MGLTSVWFVRGSMVAAVAVLVAVVVLWPRLAGREWWWYPVRAVSMLLVTALTLVAAASSLNREYGWYASWQD